MALRKTRTLSERKARKSLKFSLIRLFFIFIFLAAAYTLIGGDSGYIRINSLKKEKQRLIQEIQNLEARQEEMKREKIKLKDDLDYVEKVARERLGMIKENELLFRFSEKEVSAEE